MVSAMLTNALNLYTRFYALWVILFGLAAYAAPAPFVSVKPYMSWFFGLTMFGIGVTLKPADFKRIARQPLIVLIGCTAQFTLMPIGAFLLSAALGLPDEVAVGLILTGSAPGAMASNVMSYIAKADVAYSVSLTTVSTLLAPVLTPGLTLLLAGTRLDVSFWAMFSQVCWMVAVPLLCGFAVRALLNRRIEPMLAVFPSISATFIAVICAVVIAANRDFLPLVTGATLVACLVLNLYGMASGYGVAAAFGMETPRRRTLSIEIGMQNAGLGVVLAMEHIGDQAAVPAAIFVFVCIITASLLPAIWARTAPDPVATENPESE